MKIVGLGYGCDVRLFIKNNFESEIYPFDWLWCNIDFVIKTLDTDYFEYNECEKLIAVWDPPYMCTYLFNNKCNSTKYKICSVVSIHDIGESQLKEDYISNIPKINKKYKNKLGRLYETLNLNEDVILIRKVINKDQRALDKIHDSNEKLNHLSDLLSKNFKAKITLCVVDDESFITKSGLNDNVKLFNSFVDLLVFIKNIKLSIEKISIEN